MLQIWTKPTRWLRVPSWAIKILLNKSRLILGPKKSFFLKAFTFTWLNFSANVVDNIDRSEKF